ncbi:MAG: hypothetical protein HY646_05985 [Acidobacteria bacterium]|nr:hypothetical protein [Acidobacteriota bacterium]
MFVSKTVFVAVFMAMLVFVATDFTVAQVPTHRGSVEISGFGGINGNLISAGDYLDGVQIGLASAGIPRSRVTVDEGSKTRWLAGGSLAVAATSHLLIVAEVSHNFFANPSFNVRTGSTSTTFRTPVNIRDFTGGVHYQVPVRSRTLAPYVAFAAGASRFSASSENAPTSFSVTDVNPTVNFGGGLRFYLSDHLGFRPDVRVVRIGGDFPETYVRSAVGFFVQF